MKFLPFVFGAVGLECADAKMWNDGDDHSDETFRIFVWIARLKRLSLIAFMLLSVLLYYVPESRSHVRKACCFLIDFVADGLKFALRATDGDYRKKMRVKRRRLQNEQENQRRRRTCEKNKISTNEGPSWYREIAKPRSRRFGQDGKYQSRRRDQRRYREFMGNDGPPESYLELLSPFLQNRYQQRRAVTTRNDVCSVRLKKEYDRTVDNPLKYREDLSYPSQKFPFEYEEDYAPVDTDIPTNYYDSPCGRFDQNVADIATYRLREIIGDNKFFAKREERSVVDLEGETVRKRQMSGLRQMHGDTIPERSYNESSYTSLEAEADDENSQCGNEIATGTNFSKERDVEEATTSTSMARRTIGGYHSSSSSETLFSSRTLHGRRCVARE